MPHENKRVLIVGAGQAGAHVAKEITRHPNLGYEIIGFIDDASEKKQAQISGHPVLGNGEQLLAFVQTQKIDAIILAITHTVQDGMLKSLGDCVESGCKIINASALTEQLSERVPVHHITHAWFINQLDESRRRHYGLAKRALDISLAFIGLTVTGILFPIIALLIKLDSPGPVLYSQIRVGRKGRTFRIYKFRTMVQDAEAQGAVWAKKNDSRVTKLGDMLRKTRLDELPQLYNVLLGDMSMVGPRPERPEFVQTLAQNIPFFNRRHMVLPGLTGWAQVNYPYGASVEDALEKLQYDLYYIKNRSMFLDIEIILKTVGVVIKKQGAR
ncbi:UDP-N-acetylgalactosamine-undecaprenyl-phosphate N-acetylgalactosaminephosphotransferase [compost metagenome]